MSNSRRGLLAAGLAAAVVGSMGVVWTLNANAEETPEAPAPAVAAPADAAPAVAAPVDSTSAGAAVPDTMATDDEGDPVPTPPKLLPWGERPSKLKRARAGVSSAAVAAAGADAAPADASGSLEPTPEYAPKGRNSRTGILRKATTTVVPPAPPLAGAVAAGGNVYFHYAVGTQTGDTDGSWANLSIAKPELDHDDFHTLTEIAMQSADGRQIVEVGWTVDRTVNGDDDPHLFVYYWKDRQPSCYNACGFEMYSKTVKPGDTLPTGSQKRFGIQHSGGVWWIAYDSEWIGYFPDKLWNGTYTRAGLTQWFGEVAASSAAPCTDMGNGYPATNDAAGRIGSISMTNGPEPRAAVRATSEYYSVLSLSDRTFRFGGRGAC
ncbi:neprosin family prolyl endopeptidase [Actinoplanes sp. NPDC049681]|uniref:neprosin family prolyl endopeptidase n=1 Tax=Actinoplanes sp. NPDC049681 TaxID=3363905 RepID=UPI0037AA3BB6